LKPARIRLVPHGYSSTDAGGSQALPIPVAAGDLASLRVGDQTREDLVGKWW
jgi:hypothetical protein